MKCQKLRYEFICQYGYRYDHTDIRILTISFATGKNENKKIGVDSLEKNVGDSGKARKYKNMTVYAPISVCK